MSDKNELNIVFPIGKKPEINFYEDSLCHDHCYIYFTQDFLKMKPIFLKEDSDLDFKQKPVYEMNCLIRENEQLTQQLAERDELILELEKVREFYGNWKSWDTTSHAYHDRYNGSIKADDSLVHYMGNDGAEFSGYFGGKLARTPLKNQALLDEIKGRV